MLGGGSSWRKLCPVVFAVIGCRGAVSPRPEAVLPSRMEVSKVRESLQIAPLELVFSGVRGTAQAQESVSLVNIGSVPVQMTGLAIVGPQAEMFTLSNTPRLPLSLVPGLTTNVAIGFKPPATAALGVHRAALLAFVGPSRDPGPPVDLSALVFRGRQGQNEPPLQQIVEALGFAIDVGGSVLHLGTGADAIGDETRAARFRRATRTPVAIYPVARFSPDEPIPYGTYTSNPLALRPLAVIAAGQEQTLNPEIEPGGETTFDAGDAPFGLWVKSGKHTSYTEDARNTGPTRHAARVYALKSRGGARIPDAYLVGFEEAANGDYQDYVFVIWNVKAVPD